jgi:plastocyanin
MMSRMGPILISGLCSSTWRRITFYWPGLPSQRGPSISSSSSLLWFESLAVCSSVNSMAHFWWRYFILAAAIAKASQPNVHTVTVGRGGNFAFDPLITHAKVGEVVEFIFFPTNHSVVQGVYTKSGACGNTNCNPCIPIEDIDSLQQGFNSGNILTQSTNGDVFSHFAHLKVTNSL